jgi:D-3-phosphoglycerate dehydrogenase
MKILVTVPINPTGVNLLKSIPGAALHIQPDMSVGHLLGSLAEYDALIADVSTPITGAAIEKGTRLQVIGLLGAGRPRLDIEAATRQGVLVMNAPGSVAVSVAEHTFALIFALARRISIADASFKKGDLKQARRIGTELRNKVLGIIGCGAVGTVVAQRAMGMQMKVIVHDPHLSSDVLSRRGCRQVSRETLFRSADVITLHVPANEETRHMINRDALAVMKPSAMIVNCSAAELIDEKALYDALLKDRLGGVALDIHQDPVVKDHPLYRLARVVCTPNLSAYTKEAIAGGAVEIAQHVVDYLSKGVVSHAINLPSDEKESSGSGLQWLKLSASMGRFIIQLHPYGLKRVKVDLAGEDDLPDISAFTQSALQGMLGAALGHRVNRVNARSIAAERGVRISETRSSRAENYRNLLTISVETEQGRGVIAGTLFDDLNPRDVQVAGYELEAVPEGEFLVVFNRDRPGVIADVAQNLGHSGINIAQMYNGRDKPGGKAITLMRIDSPVTEKRLSEIRGLPNILTAARVNLSDQPRHREGASIDPE